MRRLALSLCLLFALLYGCGEVRVLTVTATAYNSVPEQTDDQPNLAAWGHELRPGDRVIAVSPDLLELGLEPGSAVRIEGLPGRYRVLDKTHARFERRIDIYMGEDIERARHWGIQEVEIRWRE
jgi:3D (Asp-Asp-Asp) domain-containing protein